VLDRSDKGRCSLAPGEELGGEGEVRASMIGARVEHSPFSALLHILW
jgi:hypothetical protein